MEPCPSRCTLALDEAEAAIALEAVVEGGALSLTDMCLVELALVAAMDSGSALYI